jgi:stearoyl-CoA desaturase (delta-9 desaturase)
MDLSLQSKQTAISARRPICWRNALFLIGTAVVALIGTPVYLWYHGFSLTLFAVFLVSSAATSMSITAGYHRMLAHRSYEGRGWLKLLYLLAGAAAFQGSALQWASDHRRHHRAADTADDPHNIGKGFFWAHMGWLFFCDDPKYSTRYPTDLERDPWIAWQHRYYVFIAVGMGFLLPLAVGLLVGDAWGYFLFVGVLRVVFTNHCTFLINSLAHTVGTRPYSDSQTARDSLLMAILAFGEGYHNYHHAFASDYRNGIRWYHWDPTKWWIRLAASVGGAYRLKTIPPSEILQARLRNEHRRLIQRGAPAERVLALKQKVEDAQRRWRLLREEYARLKLTMQIESRRHLRHLKAEIKLARLEFKAAWAQWGVYRRSLAPSPI